MVHKKLLRWYENWMEKWQGFTYVFRNLALKESGVQFRPTFGVGFNLDLNKWEQELRTVEFQISLIFVKIVWIIPIWEM